jgi:hypothetical protein
MKGLPLENRAVFLYSKVGASLIPTLSFRAFMAASEKTLRLKVRDFETCRHYFL